MILICATVFACVISSGAFYLAPSVTFTDPVTIGSRLTLSWRYELSPQEARQTRDFAVIVIEKEESYNSSRWSVLATKDIKTGRTKIAPTWEKNRVTISGSAVSLTFAYIIATDNTRFRCSLVTSFPTEESYIRVPLSPVAAVRLVGPYPYQGRVEVLHPYYATWGTICQNQFDKIDGFVVCRELGYKDVLSVTYFSSFGAGAGPIWLDNVVCGGSESSLMRCRYGGWGAEGASCTHCTEVGVSCSMQDLKVRVRLANNSSSTTEGRVEIYQYGVWGTVCDSEWDIRDAMVICRQLGLAPATAAPIGSRYGPGSGIISFHNMSCFGNETTIADCQYTTKRGSNCSVAGAACGNLTMVPTTPSPSNSPSTPTTSVDPCASLPCHNGGRCTNVPGSATGYRCICVAGFTGSNCRIQIDECKSNPCRNGGYCLDLTIRYICLCTPGFTGTHCETNIRPSLSPSSRPMVSPSSNQLSASTSTLSSLPSWPTVYTSPSNSPTVSTSPSNRPTLSTSPSNRPTVFTSPSNWSSVSTSPSNWSSVSTSPSNWSSISTSPSNLLSVSSSPSNWLSVSTSPSNWPSVSPSSSFPHTVPSTPTTSVDACTSRPCYHGARCTNVPGSATGYRCICVAGFTGSNCHIQINECKSNPCRYGGICLDYVNRYICTCRTGFTGKNCETNINECVVNKPCKNGATCMDSFGNYACRCKVGWQGKNCENDIDECVVSTPPCRNGAKCINLPGSYRCNCTAGWTGRNCYFNINECSSNPCLNGGKCKDLVNGYNCTCRPGFTGFNCKTKIANCTDNPCRNGGTCIPTANSYICRCRTGFDGQYCEEEVDECAAKPCQNGGKCQDLVNDYKCVCVAGYTGRNCEIKIS